MRALVAIGFVVALVGQDAPAVGTRSLEEWLDAWRAASREERDRMAGGLAGGVPNRPAYEEVFALLPASEAAMREAACALLRYDRDDAEKIEATLEPLLADPDADVRFHAAATLLNAARAKTGRDTLLEIAKGNDPRLRTKALRHLSSWVHVEPRIVDLLIEFMIEFEKVEDRDLRRAIVDALSSCEEERATAALRLVLHDPDEYLRSRAAPRLAAANPQDDEAVSVLFELMKSSSAPIRSSVVLALANLGASRGSEATSVVVGALRDPEANVRTSAAGSLGNLAYREGLEFPDAVPALVDMLQSEDGYERGAAAWALGHVGAETAIAVPALALLLQDPHGEARSYTLGSMKEAGADVVLALPQLIAALDDRESATRIAVAQLIALGESKSSDAANALIRRLTDAVPMVRIWSAYALREIGAAAGAAAIPVLESALAEDPEPKMRVEAARALAAFGPAAANSADTLVIACKDREVDVRLWSLFALGELRVKSDAVLATLREAADSSDVRMVAEANKSLARLGEEHDAAAVAMAPGEPVVVRPVRAPVVYDGLMLVLSDAGSAAVIDFLDEISDEDDGRSRNGVRYRFRFRALGQSDEIIGERDVHIVLQKVGEQGIFSNWEVDGTRSDLDLDAGSLHVKWTDRGPGSGNLQWRPEEMRVEIADEVEFETLDLLRFVR